MASEGRNTSQTQVLGDRKVTKKRVMYRKASSANIQHNNNRQQIHQLKLNLQINYNPNDTFTHTIPNSGLNHHEGVHVMHENVYIFNLIFFFNIRVFYLCSVQILSIEFFCESTN